jgi:glycosyltransferase involved in cell wall biosynthesis
MMEERSSPHCSIVIRAYNEENHIGRLLTGINNQTGVDYEIILVDSGSTDATVSITSHYEAKIVSIKPDDFTFGRSLNMGIDHANGEFVVVASAHVYPVYPDWLKALLAPFDDPQVALAYGNQRGNEVTKFSERQFFRQWFPDESQPRQSHPFCNNANAAIRRSFWQQHKYNEALTGLEDLAWANWAMEQGYYISYVPQAEIVHVHDEHPRQVLNRFRREAMAFKGIFPEENFHLLDFFRLYSTNVVSDMWHAMRERALWSNINSILWFRWMQFWGTYLGYRYSGTLTSQLRQVFYYPSSLGTPKGDSARGVKPIDYGEYRD